MGTKSPGSGVAATPQPLRKVNSETKFAVSLLLAVSDSRSGVCGTKSVGSAVTPDVVSERSSCSADTRIRTAPGSPGSSSQVAYVMQQMAPGVLITSPRPTGPTGASSPTTSKVAKGTPEEQRAALQRQAALARFREKKQRRHFHKKVRYLVRKKLAESRPRYKGRFSKPPADDSADKEKKTKTAGESSKDAK